MKRTTLDGLRVIITRPEGQGAKAAEAVSLAGGIPVLLPMIRILPPGSYAACDEALLHRREYHGMVFASTNAVHALFRRAKALGMPADAWRNVGAFAVGPKTADALNEYGIAARAVPAASTGAALGALLGSMDVRGKRFLLPRGDRGREEIADALATAGAEIVPVVVYRTAGPDAATASALRDILRSAGRKALLFASPSAVEECCRIFDAGELEHLLHGCVVAVIGSTTAAAAARCGVPVHGIAATPGDEGLVEALVAYVSTAPGR